MKLRYFAGLSVEEAALALDISPATAKRHWAYARAWLHDCALRAARRTRATGKPLIPSAPETRIDGRANSWG